MIRDQGLYCDDILKSIKKIEDFIAGISLDIFRNDLKTQDAVIRNLEIIGEAVRNISEDIKAKYPEIAWRSAGDMRNFLIHEYPDVITDIVWSAAIKDLPLLKKQIVGVIKSEGF